MVPLLDQDVYDLEGLSSSSSAACATSRSASAAQIGVEVPAEDVAQQRAQVVAHPGDEHVGAIGAGGQAADRRALERDRLGDLGHDRPVLAWLRAQRREPAAEPAARRALGLEQRAQREQDGR